MPDFYGVRESRRRERAFNTDARAKGWGKITDVVFPAIPPYLIHEDVRKIAEWVHDRVSSITAELTAVTKRADQADEYAKELADKLENACAERAEQKRTADALRARAEKAEADVKRLKAINIDLCNKSNFLTLDGARLDARVSALEGALRELRDAAVKEHGCYPPPYNVTPLLLALQRADTTLSVPPAPTASQVGYQDRVGDWMLACFGAEISADRIERNHRFLEEALELVQANGCTRSEAHQLVEYVFGRPDGDINQEVGGVMVTLAALCRAIGVDMLGAGETELSRIWGKVEQIRAKQAAKPKHSPLPGGGLT